jgi:hypothetical protein
VREQRLKEVAPKIAPDQQVLAAGILQPQGAMEGMSSRTASDALGAPLGGTAARTKALGAERGVADGVFENSKSQGHIRVTRSR